MRYGAWVHASQPVADSITDNLYGLSPEEVNRRKSKIFSALTDKFRSLAKASDAFVASVSTSGQGPLDRYHMSYTTDTRGIATIPAKDLSLDFYRLPAEDAPVAVLQPA